MRLKICKEGDKLLQYFNKYENQDIRIVDVDTEEDVKRLEDEIINKQFELFDSYLYDVLIYRYKNNYGGILIKLNHVIGDGYTLGLLLYEVLGYYSRKIKRIISFSYLNYIKSEEKYPRSRKYRQDKEFWEKELDKGVPAVAYIPANKENYSYTKAKKIFFEIDDDIVDKVKKICKDNEISYTTFYMSIIAILINKKTNLDNFFLTAAQRNRRKIKELLTAGMLTKTAYFIVKVKNEGFVDFAREMRLTLKSSYKHMNYIYNYGKELFKKYNDDRQIPSNVFVSYQNMELKTDKMNMNFEIDGDNNVGTYGTEVVSIHIFEYKGKVKIIYDYLSEKYTEDEIKELNDSIVNIIKQISENNNIMIEDIKI